MTKRRQGGFLISKVHQLSGRIFARKLKSHHITNLNPAQGRILFTLWQQDMIPIQELATRTSLDKSTLTRMLDKLEEIGHVVREFPEDDRRKVLIRLTEANLCMKEEYEQVSAEMNGLFYQGFTDHEMDEFEGYLERIFANLRQEELQDP